MLIVTNRTFPNEEVDSTFLLSIVISMYFCVSILQKRTDFKTCINLYIQQKHKTLSKNLQHIDRVEIIVLDNQGAVHIPESGQISPGLEDDVDREDQADREDENKVKEIEKKKCVFPRDNIEQK